MKFTIPIKKINVIQNWDDLLDPSKMDSEEYIFLLMRQYKHSKKILHDSDFIISIKRKSV